MTKLIKSLLLFSFIIFIGCAKITYKTDLVDAEYWRYGSTNIKDLSIAVEKHPDGQTIIRAGFVSAETEGIADILEKLDEVLNILEQKK